MPDDALPEGAYYELVTERLQSHLADSEPRPARSFLCFAMPTRRTATAGMPGL